MNETIVATEQQVPITTRKWCLVLSLLLFNTSVAFAGDGQIRGRIKPISGQYNVVLHDFQESEIEEVIDELVRHNGGKAPVRWKHGVRGFMLVATEAQAKRISADPRVRFVEQDSIVEIAASTPSWALDRIDERVTPRTDNDYNYCPGGNGVYVYVVDTGIWAQHSQFSNLSSWTGGARVKPGYDYEHSPHSGFGHALTDHTDTNPCYPSDNPFEMRGSHGTAVASAIGGDTLGAAREAILRPVRAMDCAGTNPVSAINSAIDWILAPCPAPTGDPLLDANRLKVCDTEYIANSPRVANLSFSYEIPTERSDADMTSLEAKIASLVSAGITVVTAAGNYNRPVGTTYSPARMEAIITVGATENTSDDRRWVNPDQSYASLRGSNYGPQIDLFAPGHEVRVAHWSQAPSSALDTNGVRTSSHSGTSFSSAYVSGAAARILGSGGSGLSPQQVRDRLVGEATNTGSGLNIGNRGSTDTPNLLLFSFGCGRPRI